MRVTAFARGFNNLIGAINQGVGIQECSDALVPTIDVRDLITLNRRVLISNSAAPGVFFPFAVPRGEVWALRWFGQQWTTGAADTVTGAFLALAGDGGNIVPLTPHITLGINSSGALTADLTDLVISSGYSLGMRANTVTGAPSQTMTLLYDVMATTS